MAAALARSKTPIAIDVEAHAEFSFEGFACLLQVSARTKDYVVDCLVLRAEVGPALRAVFADPAVRKVFHSCEGVDIPRLDRAVCGCSHAIDARFYRNSRVAVRAGLRIEW